MIFIDHSMGIISSTHAKIHTDVYWNSTDVDWCFNEVQQKSRCPIIFHSCAIESNVQLSLIDPLIYNKATLK